MTDPRHNMRDIYPPTGTEITAKSWQTEAAMRMLMNNLHPDVAENPHELVVYGGIGRAARTWDDFDRIIAALKALDDDETLLVQSGKPVGVFKTHADVPRVLIANSNLVPHWATWEHFNELDKKGLAMYGQMTAGSWIYIGTQGIVQGTYETFVEAGRQHYGGDLTGRWIPTAGLGGIGPFRWVALSGDPEDIYATDRAMKELFPENKALHNWLDMARERIAFQGLPARICWIGLGDRHRAGLKFSEMVRSGELKAPVVIGRDHLDAGSVASPNRETEAMKDGSDAVSDWPLLNALLSTASGATWVSLHHGGGVGMGFSQHSGMVIVADGTDGTDDAARRLARVLWNDPATGVMRHADAGYDIAQDCAREHGLNLPGILE